MQVSVTGKQVEIDPTLNEHIGWALDQAVGKYFHRAIEAHVVLKRQRHLYQADVSVHAGPDLVVQGHGEADAAHAAVDLAAERVAKQLRRQKRRIREHRR